ncbi:hypothetical protein K0M31_007263 [Melipona bicolor]|uniref:Uncharacterized protein n=1 Tax=Melipona bicolor TaxID=60889 RepID=A0AA40GCE4_9HYME|nr:hypothetical protein K0M31_007263 [Melipona bicolor]
MNNALNLKFLEEQAHDIDCCRRRDSHVIIALLNVVVPRVDSINRVAVDECTSAINLLRHGDRTEERVGRRFRGIVSETEGELQSLVVVATSGPEERLMSHYARRIDEIPKVLFVNGCL